MLFANDFDAGRTFIFNLKDPAHPKVATEFSERAGYAFPHSFVRLPNGHVLASFQYRAGRDADARQHDGRRDRTQRSAHRRTGRTRRFRPCGSLGEQRGPGLPGRGAPAVQPCGTASASTACCRPTRRCKTTRLLRSNTAQLWRLSDLKLLKTFRLDPGDDLYAHMSPEEVRVGPDGAAYIQTLACGIERVTGMEGTEPKAQLVYTFPGSWCGVPTFVGRYLVEGIPDIHGFIVLDMTRRHSPA